MSAPDGAPLNIFATLRKPSEAAQAMGGVRDPRAVEEQPAAPATVSCSSSARDGQPAPYEWGQHVAIALRSDITQEEIDRVPAGPDAPGWSPFDATLLRLADELHDGATRPTATWATLAERYSTQQLMDAVFAVGQYTWSRMR